MFDGRSKIDQCHKDTKQRLSLFFKEVHQLLTNGYSQISMEESSLKKSSKGECNELKKVLKKI